MHIHKIRIKNFKSFYDTQEINFDDLRGLWRVSGQIGSGKTTIGEAIVYGLYGSISGKNNKDLISWGEKHATVEIWCSCRGNEIYIHRELNAYGQSPLSVTVNDEPLVFTDKRDAQSQLEQEYLDASRSIMELLCIISFNSFKSLSTLNAKDTKLFLDNVLGLDVLTTYSDACKEQISGIRNDVLKYQAQISALENQITRLSNIQFVDGDSDEVENEIDLLNLLIKDKQKDYDTKRAPFDRELVDKQTKSAQVVALGKIKKKEIDFIKKGVCPTCGAPIDQSTLTTKEQEREVLMDQYKSINSDISQINAHITELTEELNKYVSEKKDRVKSLEKRLIQLQEQAKRVKLDESEIQKLRDDCSTTQKLKDVAEIDMQQYIQLIDILSVQVRSKVLESFIPTINNKIKELAGMLNLQYIPEYDSMFKCTIKTAGLQQIPTNSLSTGQLKMVDMVIILGILSSVIAKVSSNIIFLDELFSNLDPRTRADLVNVLKVVIPSESSVLIVSHQDMDMDSFDGQIRMKLEQGDGKKYTTVNIMRS